MSEQLIRRRIDRVTADDYLASIHDASAATLRLMRDECRDEEGRISYARRLLHGQLDIVRAEVQRRVKERSNKADNTEAIAQNLLETIGAALAEDTATPSPQRAQQYREFLYNPDNNRGRRRGDTLLSDVPIGKIRELSVDELADMVDNLTTEVNWATATRSVILSNLDELQEELVARYRSGATSVTEIV